MNGVGKSVHNVPKGNKTAFLNPILGISFQICPSPFNILHHPSSDVHLFLNLFILECVSKSWEIQFRVDLPAVQGAFPKAAQRR